MNAVPPGEVAPDWAITALRDAGRRMHERDWVPATAGNLSARVAPNRIAITRSGCHKGYLTLPDILMSDLDGRVAQGSPSAETPLHLQIYRLFPETGAVLHGHSVAATTLSLAERGEALCWQGYEVQKALGQESHEERLVLPVLDNDQDMPRLMLKAAPVLRGGAPAYLLRGHGLYVWGRDVAAAMHRLEATEFLLRCLLARRQIGIL